jgi:hypothetical protein
MGALFAWLGQLFGGSFASLFTALSNSVFQYFAKSKDTTLDGFKTASGLDEKAYEAWLAYEQANATIAEASPSWWGPKLLLMMVGAPACLHVALVFLDSSLKLGCNHYGCLNVPDVPTRWIQTENMVLSFVFGVSVVGPMASSVTAWLHRR